MDADFDAEHAQIIVEEIRFEDEHGNVIEVEILTDDDVEISA